ncbi:MAG: PhoX family phosphatase [Rhodospirillaceae bacterium]|nr:PhoX family phosphatase [Rhodospirillaceae bacterium]
MTVRDISAYSNRGEAYEASQDTPVNPSSAPTMGDIINARFGRRDMIRGALAVSAISATAAPLLLGSSTKAQAQAGRFVFDEIAHGVDETHHVADGYSANILIRWGDPVEAGAPEFDPMNQTADAQEMQFGYNCDFIGYVDLPDGAASGEHGLLFVNHEYTNEEVMFPGIGDQEEAHFADMTRDLVDIEMAAHGCSIIEVRKDGGTWQVVPDSEYARRISTRSTWMQLTGPAAGSDRLKTPADPTGTRVIGTVNNCAGGQTPWGTFLTAEENFHGYFWGELDPGHPEFENYDRYGVPDNWYAWGRYYDRFDINAVPNEANRFGWVVEVDPMDRNSVPKKRTALGRCKHENAETILNGDGRVVVYCGDDERFEYVYKFVTEGTYNADDRAANMDLLDSGTLYVARYDEDGSGEWLALVHGQGPLTAENGFNSQADVVINARKAGDLLGATPMDRPEDVEANPVTNKVYVNLTNNSRRKADGVNGPNARAENNWGHIVEMTPAGDDHTATAFTWEILVQCGDPADGAVGAVWNSATSENGWFSCPDNMAFDAKGRMWVATDQGGSWSRVSGSADGVWAMETEGELRGTGKMFFRVPIGAEMCGPRFTPDDRTLFVSVQHPATDGTAAYPGFERNSTFEDPATRWPDFQDGMPPRPSVVVITKDDGGEIGV